MMSPIQWSDLPFDMNVVSVVSDNARSHERRRPAKRPFQRCSSLPEDNRSRLPPAPLRRMRRSSIAAVSEASSFVTCMDETICRWTRIKISANNDVPPVLKRRHFEEPAITLSNANLNMKTQLPGASTSSPWRNPSKTWKNTTPSSYSVIQQVLESMEDSDSNIFLQEEFANTDKVANADDDAQSISSVEMNC